MFVNVAEIDEWVNSLFGIGGCWNRETVETITNVVKELVACGVGLDRAKDYVSSIVNVVKQEYGE